MIFWSPRRSIGGSDRGRAVSGREPPESVDRAIHRASLGVQCSRICSGNNRPTSQAADECDNRDLRPAGRRRCQRRDDAATAPRTIVAAEDARTRVPDDTLDNGPGDGIPDDETPDDVPAPGRTDAERAPAGVAARTAASSGPASGRFCTACSIADSTCDNSIPATWSQAGPGSRGGS